MYLWHIFAFFIIISSSSCLAQKYSSEANDIININSVIDDVLPDIHNAIKRFGFDPMKVPDVFDQVNSLNSVNLTNGAVTGVSTMERGGDFYLSFHQGTARLHSRVHFEKLEGKFNYSVTSGYSIFAVTLDYGIMKATMNNVTANMSIDFSLDTFTLMKPELHVENYGSISISLLNDSSWDSLKGTLATLITAFYNEHIIAMCEKSAMEIALKVIKDVNKNLKQTIADTLFRIIANPRQFIQDVHKQIIKNNKSN